MALKKESKPCVLLREGMVGVNSLTDIAEVPFGAVYRTK